MSNDRAALFEKIAGELQNLTESPLYSYRVENNYLPVMGEGDLYAKIMFIGEAPGEREAKTGRPFVGASGRLLSEFLQSIGLKREDVYITNVVKDRPPKNRDPKPDEIELYTPFLIRQIEIIQPKVIATLGRFAMDFVFELFDMAEQGQKISKLHGQLLRATTPSGDISVIPLYHPAVAIYSGDRKETLRQDFQVLKAFL